MTDKVAGPDGLGVGAETWVCPLGICSYADAQHCRTLNGNTKISRGCGSIFAPGTTLEQAKAQITQQPSMKDSLSRAQEYARVFGAPEIPLEE